MEKLKIDSFGRALTSLEEIPEYCKIMKKIYNKINE
jgi:hypothetical protein